MNVVLNGEEKNITSQLISSLLVELDLLNKKVAVEHNKKIVPKDAYDLTHISEGDRIEIVHFIGGG